MEEEVGVEGEGEKKGGAGCFGVGVGSDGSDGSDGGGGRGVRRWGTEVLGVVDGGGDGSEGSEGSEGCVANSVVNSVVGGVGGGRKKGEEGEEEEGEEGEEEAGRTTSGGGGGGRRGGRGTEIHGPARGQEGKRNGGRGVRERETVKRNKRSLRQAFSPSGGGGGATDQSVVSFRFFQVLSGSFRNELFQERTKSPAGHSDGGHSLSCCLGKGGRCSKRNCTLHPGEQHPAVRSSPQ